MTLLLLNPTNAGFDQILTKVHLSHLTISKELFITLKKTSMNSFSVHFILNFRRQELMNQ